jgi:hypothetical protein
MGPCSLCYFAYHFIKLEGEVGLKSLRVTEGCYITVNSNSCFSGLCERAGRERGLKLPCREM